MHTRTLAMGWFGLALTASASWTPLQLELGPHAGIRLCDETTDVYGLRLAVVGKNAQVRGLDLAVGRAIVDKDFGGIQVSIVGDVAGDAVGLQMGLLHAMAGGACHGLQTSVIWCEADRLRGGQVGLFNEARDASGVQLGIVNWTDEAFHGLSLGAVCFAGSCGSAAQVGLLWNSVAQPSSGVQIGLVDRAGDYGGVQIGVADWRKNGRGIQAGIYNDADDFGGLQLGAVSIARRAVGFQLGLLGNGAFDVRGAQVGLLNVAGRDGVLDGEVTGVQAGLLNRLGTLRGMQFGGMNDAAVCRGVQIGLFNRAGTLQGLQLGLLNLSHSGGLQVSPLLNFSF